MELIAARRPRDGAALAEFASAYLRRLSADSALATSPQELFAEVSGAFDFAAGRGDRPILVRAFNPVADLHGYERPGTSWRRARRTCRSSWTRSAPRSPPTSSRSTA